MFYWVSYSFKDLKGSFHFPIDAESQKEALKIAKEATSGAFKATLFASDENDNKSVIAEKIKGFIWKYC